MLVLKISLINHSYDNDKWTSENETIIKFEEVVSARIYVLGNFGGQARTANMNL